MRSPSPPTRPREGAAFTFAGGSRSVQPPFSDVDMKEASSFGTDDHGRYKRSASKFRPDFHVNVQKSLDKFTFREFMLGAVCVAEALVEDGRPVAGYLSHLRFIAWKSALSGAFQTLSLIKYDQHVSAKVIKGEIPDWILGEEEAVCLHLGVDGTLAFKQLTGGFHTSGTRSGKGAVRGDFSDFPQDVCWLYNFRSCEANICKRKHICLACKGAHREKMCSDKTRSSVLPDTPQTSK